MHAWVWPSRLAPVGVMLGKELLGKRLTETLALPVEQAWQATPVHPPPRRSSTSGSATEGVKKHRPGWFAPCLSRDRLVLLSHRLWTWRVNKRVWLVVMVGEAWHGAGATLSAKGAPGGNHQVCQRSTRRFARLSPQGHVPVSLHTKCPARWRRSRWGEPCHASTRA